MSEILERDKIVFLDVASLRETPSVRQNANVHYLQAELDKALTEKVIVKSVKINESGSYRQGFKKTVGLPKYIEVVVNHSFGEFTEEIVIWSPLAWNDRFFGTGGGGTATGGRNFTSGMTNTQRGMAVPNAVKNGYTAATTDAGNPEREWALSKDGKLLWERVENWRARSTHLMTQVGKAVAEALHGRKVKYSYFHGGSGGGRQAMVEAQEYPADYDGIWASCPGINWTKFFVSGLWSVAVMNSLQHVVSPKKMDYFLKKIQEAYGGSEKFYALYERVDFSYESLIGEKVGKELITQEDCEVVREMQRGPHRANGEFLWYGMRPGVLCWNVGIPVGAYYYSFITHRPKQFFLVYMYFRWITEQRKQKFNDVTIEQTVQLFDESVTKFASATADKADLTEFYAHGGKLFIDHGTHDPLIPVDGTIDYFERMKKIMGSEKVDEFCRFYLTPGDGHGTCNWFGAGITESDGMTALINWVEKDEKPSAIRKIRVGKKGNLLCESTQMPYNK